MTRFAISVALFLSVTFSAFGQIDAFTLRSKYGPPVDRETFNVRPGMEMVVDYGPSKQVCRIQLPSGMRIVGQVPAGAVTKQQVDEVLNEVVPPSMRGALVNRGSMMMSLYSVSFTEYEHVSISESHEGAIGKGVTVIVKDASCPQPKAP